LSKAVVVVNGPPQRFDVTLVPAPVAAPAPPTAKPAPAPRVVLTAERIVILEKVFFDTGKATIKKQSFGLLGEVAAILQAHPELARVRVEGHTDSRGDDQKNLTLSQRRADAVVAWLVKAGINPSRLEGRGFGETKPLDPAETAAAWDQNRRVEFIIAPSTP
jgi:outer membrane protein OmpA-like peptidoglycan-associated protein